MIKLTSDAGLRRLALTTAKLKDARRAVAERDGDRIWEGLDPAEHAELKATALRLESNGVELLVRGDPNWPESVEDLSSPPLYLFAWGRFDYFEKPAIGMCGSRKASDRGLNAARLCGANAAAFGLQVVSGYAAGVDTATHLAALAAGAGTVIVLPEGIENFKIKKAFREGGLTSQNALVISQFAPRQRWTAGGAMTRNGLICTLGRALVVIEAGERGGTLNAGRQALRSGRAVLALEFGEGGEATPAGNELLFAEGARRIGTAGQLRDALRELV